MLVDLYNNIIFDHQPDWYPCVVCDRSDGKVYKTNGRIFHEGDFFADYRNQGADFMGTVEEDNLVVFETPYPSTTFKTVPVLPQTIVALISQKLDSASAERVRKAYALKYNKPLTPAPMIKWGSMCGFTREAKQ